VPKGAVTQQPPWKSTIFSGTVRDWWIYVPAQYKADKPACVMVVQDGGGWVREDGAIRAPIVFDNLIHKGQMPVTIGIFINPGVLPALGEAAQARYNRSFEYDAVSDRYARFLIEEILPEVRKSYNLSKDPNDYAIAGSSSGASCAFTAAWHRPDQFRRVHSWIGSYVNLRGAEVYPDLIRKTEPKPLRIFLQDGKRDNNIYAGSWYIANQDMAAAFEYAGYDVRFVVGEEAHNSRHGASILPDSLRWLWRDHPKPIAKPRSERQTIAAILDPDSEWELVSQGHRFTEGPAVDKAGNVFFTDIPNNRIHRIDAGSGQVSVFKEDTGGANGLMFGPDGRLYACQNGRKKIVAYTPDGAESVIAEGLDSNDLCVTARGELYVTDPPNKRVWFIDAKGAKRVVIDKGLEFPNGVRLSADQSLLLVVDMRNKWVWSYQVQPDGSVAHGQAFYRLEVPDDSSQSGGDGMTVDSEGFLYVTTRIGVQVCDQPGRVNGIINKPHPGSLSNAVFGGPALDWLFVTAGDRVYKRHMRRKGVTSWTPVKPPQPRL
jgi:sugar lactone lactonase YvrE/enterochelin esterase-like enzyme